MNSDPPGSLLTFVLLGICCELGAATNHHPKWLETQATYSLAVLEAESPKSGCLAWPLRKDL